jgi:hypothetical protein
VEFEHQLPKHLKEIQQIEVGNSILSWEQTGRYIPWREFYIWEDVDRTRTQY